MTLVGGTSNMNLDRRDHTEIHFDELRDLLGMTGVPLRVWIEPGGEFVHMITIPDDTDPHGKLVAKGGYAEVRNR